MSFKFEKLIVWQKAVYLATDVHELVNFFEAQNTSYEVDSHAHKAMEKVSEIKE